MSPSTYTDLRKRGHRAAAPRRPGRRIGGRLYRACRGSILAATAPAPADDNGCAVDAVGTETVVPSRQAGCRFHNLRLVAQPRAGLFFCAVPPGIRPLTWRSGTTPSRGEPGAGPEARFGLQHQRRLLRRSRHFGRQRIDELAARPTGPVPVHRWRRPLHSSARTRESRPGGEVRGRLNRRETLTARPQQRLWAAVHAAEVTPCPSLTTKSAS